MYEVTVSNEFARWFAALEGRDLEEVASSLDVLAALGPALDPVKASRLLLWFDGCEEGPLRPFAQGLALERSTHGERVQELMAWQQEIVRCLESPVFAARLAALDGATAATVIEAVERVQQILRAARELESLRALTELQAGGPISRSTARYLSTQGRAPYLNRQGAERPRELIQALRRAFHEVLAAAGLDVMELHDPASGLREITLRQLTPALRLLYGIDVPRKRVLVLLGEPLTRAYYGDSVRFAERRFREYMQGSELIEEVSA
jgi:hypothetical protein